ncbi:unnamed protein product, partial [Meganyctiphanes norvegica]
MNYSREEMLEKIQQIKETINIKGYGHNFGRINQLTAFEMHLGLPITYQEVKEDLGIHVKPIGENNAKVDRILNRLNEKAKPTKDNAKIVEQFLYALEDILYNEKGVLKKSKITHVGSSYEGLVVKAKSDFDIPLILSDSFAGSYFKITRDPKTLLFKLQWKDDPPEKYNKYCDEEFLNAKELQKDIFKRIHTIIDQIHLPGWTLEAKDGLAAVGITLKKGQRSIPIDLA